MCAVSRRGLSRGMLSHVFTAQDMVTAAKDDGLGSVFVDVDAAGFLTGGARAAARARLAPHVHACNAVLSRARAAGDTGGPDGGLRLRLVRAVAPLHELLLWFDEELLAALDMPFLTLRNIRGRREYECHECGARFEEPNPLKSHLFLRCATAAPARFWRLVAARLAPAPSSAFRRVAPAPPAAPEPAARLPAPAPASRALTFRLPPPSPEDAAAARLEALATEWGRARGGHACVYCGKLYSRKYGLKIHIRTHTGYRPLRCRHCLRAFGDPSNLNKHVRLHAAGGAGGAGHACARCGKALVRRRDLERHLRARCAPPPAPPAPPAADGQTSACTSTTLESDFELKIDKFRQNTK